jgi:hypothetical protein
MMSDLPVKVVSDDDDDFSLSLSSCTVLPIFFSPTISQSHPFLYRKIYRPPNIAGFYYTMVVIFFLQSVILCSPIVYLHSITRWQFYNSLLVSLTQNKNKTIGNANMSFAFLAEGIRRVGAASLFCIQSISRFIG